MIRFYLTHDSPYEVVAFTVDGERVQESTLLGLPVVAYEDLERDFPPDRFGMSIPISYRQLNHLRAEKYGSAKAKGYELITYVSSKAHTWPGLDIGDNCLVMEGATIGPYARIGSDVFLGYGTLISHDDVIGSHCFIAPAAVVLGYVRVGEYCLVGANATIRDGVSIAAECLIGSGVTIARDTQPGEVFISSQAEALPKRSEELREWLTWAR